MPKPTERYKKIKEKLELEAKEEVIYTKYLYDTIKTEDGKYAVIKISYNESGASLLELTGEEFENPSRADATVQQHNTQERLRRMRKGEI